MNVLVFQGYVDPGGRMPGELLRAWPTLPGVAEAIAAAGARVDVVVAAGCDARLDADGVRYTFVRERSAPSPRRLLGHRAAPHPRRALAYAARRVPDVIHLHGLSFPRQATTLRRAHPLVPLLAQDHADRPPTGWRRPFHHRGLASLDAVAFTARALARPFVEAGLLREDVPIFEVVEGSTRFTPGPDVARASGDPPLVLAVGDLTPGKDPMTVLDGVAGTAAAGVELRLRLVFRAGALERSVRARVMSDPVLRGRVELVGALPHDRIEAELRRADLYVSASRREGSGYAAIEALACGTPVVLSAIPAHEAVLGGAPCGAVFPPGDGRGLARTLAALVPRAESMRAHARARFEAALSFPAIGRALVEAYETLVGAGAGARPLEPRP